MILSKELRGRLMRDAHAGAMKKVKKGKSYPGFLGDDHPIDHGRSTDDEASADDMGKREAASRVE